MYYRVITNEGGNINMKMKKVLAIGLSAAMIMSVTPGTVTADDLDADVAVAEFSDDADDTVALESEEPEVEENDSDQAAEIEFQDEDTDVQQAEDHEVNNDDVTLFSDGEGTVSAVGDGDDSDDLQWHLEDSDEDGFDDTLVVDGYGDMSGYIEKTDYPWYSYANSVVNLIIGDNITAIGRNAFREFENLKSVTMGKNVVEIKSSAFEKCSKLSTLVLSESLKEIGWYAFMECTSLEKLTIPDSVITIGNNAFSKCSSLYKIKMSMNVETIGDSAFYECNKWWNEIFLPISLKKIGKNAFFRIRGNQYHFSLSKVHYPGSKNDWQKIEGSDMREDYGDSLTDLVHYVAHHAEKPATCTTSGFEEYWTCNRCGQYAFADIECTQKLEAVPIIPALGHDLDQGNVSKEANCTEEGIATYSCQRDGCDYTETKSIPTNGKHIYEEPSYTWNEDNTECTATEICSLCKYEDIESVKTQETTLIPATCSQEGKVHYTAVFTNNNFTTQDKEVIVPQLSHKNTEIRNARNATCENSGYSGDIYCKDCGKFLSEGSIIKAKGHLWDDGTVKKEPTCVEKGEKVYTCFRCNATKTEKLEAVGHKWNDKETTDLKATCTTSGRKSIHCSVCDEIQDGSQQIIPALGHNWSEGVIEKKATCTEKGMQIVTCLRCGKEKEEEIPAVGHAVVRDEEIPATCETDGKTEGNHCSVCGKILTEQKIIPATGHKEVKDTAVAATCEKDGLTEGSHCSVCGKVLAAQNVVKAIGHSWDEGKITKEATCEENGVKTYTCANCKATKTEDIKALGHKEVKDAAVTATCEKDGLTEGIHCSVCNKVLTEQQKVPATGHKFSSWKTTSQATVFSPEQQSHSCSVCGKSENREIGSKLQKTMTVTATSLPLKTKQKTTVLRVSGLAVGDSIISWKSSNTKVAKVSGRANGTSTITAGKKKGTAKITITLKSGLQKVVKVTVQKSTVKTKKITGVSKSLKLNKKQRAVLRPVIAPLTSKQKITYKSSNSKVASVNSKGQITAKKKGTAVITVKSGSKTVKCKVTVK